MKTKGLIMGLAVGLLYARPMTVLGQTAPYKFLKNQTDVSRTNRGGARVLLDTKPGEIANISVLRDGTTKVRRVDLREEVDLIVEFKEAPLFIQQLTVLPGMLQKSAFQNRFEQFSSDLSVLQQSASHNLRATLPQPLVSQHYYRVFFGVALKAPRALITPIRELSYVKSVHENVQMQANLRESVHLIRADTVWTVFGTRGEGVIVGIFDTGIDYTHPALGGGIGPDFKVIGGFDFVTGRNNPMDDNGHGTHVSGIIAADGDSIKDVDGGNGIRGVAPKAKLFAFKVLDGNGFGREDSIISAVERMAVWNADNPGRRIQVANMSLGGVGDPDDPLSEAVDNAVRLGVTFCVAAGNSGTFKRISSPGTSRLAITVGASDDFDQMASFSSKGPNNVIYSIKPDLVAPGVNVLSTVLNNRFASFSGTSMATPHVAGVCALLKSLHPGWTPGQLKSAVMTSAVDLREEAMVQGAGRVDAFRAAQTGAFCVPSSLSFGLDSSFFDTWTANDTVWVTNVATVPQQFECSFESLPAGASLYATPQSFFLQPKDSQMVVATLIVDNNVVPYSDRISLTYSGTVHIRGDRDTLHVPWAFVKASKVILTFNEPSFGFVITSDTYMADDFNADYSNQRAELIVPKGTYDLFSYFYSQKLKFVFKEQIVVQGLTPINVNSHDAQYSVAIKGVDEAGQPLPAQSKGVSVVFPNSSPFRDFSFIGGAWDTIFTTPFTNRFSVLTGQFSFDGAQKAYMVQHQPLQGVQSNVTLTNAPADFYPTQLKATYAPDALIRYLDFILWTKVTLQGGSSYFGIPVSPSVVVGPTWSGTLRVTRETDPGYGFFSSLEALQPAIQYWDSWWFYTPPFTVARDSIGVYFGNAVPASAYLTPKNETMAFGESPIYTDVNHMNNYYGKSNIVAFPYFYGALDEIRYSDIPKSQYTIYDLQNNVVVTDTLFDMVPVDVAPGEYRLEVKNPHYFVNNVRANATLTTWFDLRKTDPNPAGFTSLRLLNARGVSSTTMTKGEKVAARFSAADLSYIHNEKGGTILRYAPLASDSTRMYYRKNGTAAWTGVPVSKILEDSSIGFLYSADLGTATEYDSAAVDLKLHVRDEVGNVTEWMLEPAFAVGKFGITMGVDEAVKLPGVPTVFALMQNYPNPFNPQTTISFDLPRHDNVELRIYDILGQLVVTLLHEQRNAGRYRVVWDGRDQHGWPVSTGTYFYRLRAGEHMATKKLTVLK